MRTRKRILIVEDADANIELLIQLLEERYEVLVATSGEAGIAMAARETPDLILMDLSLPVIDGWEATRRIKADESLGHIPVIALTAHTMKGDRELALDSGCDEYLEKPLDEDLLYEKLDQFLGG